MGFIIGGSPLTKEVAQERPEREDSAVVVPEAVAEETAVASEEPAKKTRKGRRRNVKE